MVRTAARPGPSRARGPPVTASRVPARSACRVACPIASATGPASGAIVAACCGRTGQVLADALGVEPIDLAPDPDALQELRR
jgi:hypothetical protein